MKFDLPHIDYKMSNEAYHAIKDALSSSVIKTASADGWQATHQLLTGKRPFESRALVLGSAMHLAVADPKEFAETFVTAPSDFKTSTSQKFEAYAQAHGISTEYLLTETERDNALAMAQAIRDKISGFKPDGVWLAEPSLFWSENGRFSKCRPDILVLDRLEEPQTATYIEAKSATWVRPNAVKGAFWRFGYPLQQAWYERGIRECFPSLVTTGTVFVFAESRPPHNCRAYCLNVFDSIAADKMIDRILEQLAEREKYGNWEDDTMNAPTEIFMGLQGGDDLEGFEEGEDDDG